MKDLEKYLNKWVKINFHNSLLENKFHPDDMLIIKNITSFTNWFVKCIAVDDNYITINYLDSIIRVIPTWVNIYPDSKFQIDELIIYTSKNEKKQGFIYGIDWHNNENKHIYYVKEANGKMKSSRYFEEDLEKV